MTQKLGTGFIAVYVIAVYYPVINLNVVTRNEDI
jgi:hypothetical protein